jgi:hypothetical protein
MDLDCDIGFNGFSDNLSIIEACPNQPCAASA